MAISQNIIWKLKKIVAVISINKDYDGKKIEKLNQLLKELMYNNSKLSEPAWISCLQKGIVKDPGS